MKNIQPSARLGSRTPTIGLHQSDDSQDDFGTPVYNVDCTNLEIFIIMIMIMITHWIIIN